MNKSPSPASSAETESVDSATIAVDVPDDFRPGDLHDLCDATEQAIAAGGGFGWVTAPPREMLERYWNGVMVIPERVLFVGRLDGVIGGSLQLITSPKNNQAQALAAHLTTAFVAPWARGRGMLKQMLISAEAYARRTGLRVLNLDVRETQTVAIRTYEDLGYVRIGTHPLYAQVGEKILKGYYYYKDLQT